MDELLGYEDSDEALSKMLIRILVICEAKHLKLNLKKCEFWKKKPCGAVELFRGKGLYSILTESAH